MLVKRYDISSLQNEKYKWLLSLRESKAIREEKACLVFGAKIVNDILMHGKHKVLFQCLRGSEITVSNHVDVLQLSNSLFDELDEFGTHSAFLVVETPAMSKWSPDRDPNGLEIISPLQDPQNLGALARTAVAFGARSLVLTKESANPFLPKSIRASVGAVLDLQLQYAPTLLEVSLALEERAAHQDQKKDCFALDMAGASIHNFPWPENCYLLIGEEGRGLPQSKTPRLHIPIQKVESLNATVATALAISSYRQKHPLKAH